MQHGELFHALVALSQVYYNIDVKGFGSTHWTALYHRGESLKQLRLKVESARSAEDDAAILTALWLMDVEVRVAEAYKLSVRSYHTHRLHMVISRHIRCTNEQRKEWWQLGEASEVWTPISRMNCSSMST